MQFSSQHDIDAPVGAAFEVLTDFDAIEQGARTRKVDISRLDTLTEKGVGLSWDIGFKFRGKRRELIVDLTEFNRPEAITFTGVSSTFSVEVSVSLSAITATTTRMKTTFEVTPRSLGARLMIQSAKLGKSSLNKKFTARTGQFAKSIGERARTA